MRGYIFMMQNNYYTIAVKRQLLQRVFSMHCVMISAVSRTLSSLPMSEAAVHDTREIDTINLLIVHRESENQFNYALRTLQLTHTAMYKSLTWLILSFHSAPRTFAHRFLTCVMPGFHHSVDVLPLPFRQSRSVSRFRTPLLLPLPLRIFLLFTDHVMERNFLT